MSEIIVDLAERIGRLPKAPPGHLCVLDAPLDATHPHALVFFAAGAPKPKGSHKAFVIAGRARIAPASSGERGWREVVTAAARDAMQAARVAPLECAVDVLMEFYEQRPKAHFRTNGQLKPNAQARPTKAPDWDKLARSVGDALNGVCWRDDAQVCEGRIRKLYTSAAQPYVGVRVTVRPYVGE
jgi:Holliday junction resolvase RusA-like endonuclease